MQDDVAGPDGSALSEGLGPLVEAAEKYAANYSDDARQDITCDVLNAFYAGAKFGTTAERERWSALAAHVRCVEHAHRVGALEARNVRMMAQALDDVLGPNVK